MKHHHLIQAVHEFRGEFAPRSFNSRALYLFIQAGCRLVFRLNKTHAAFHQFGDFASTQVRGEKNDRFGQVHFAIVAERQRRLVQHAQ